MLGGMRGEGVGGMEGRGGGVGEAGVVAEVVEEGVVVVDSMGGEGGRSLEDRGGKDRWIGWRDIWIKYKSAAV